MTINTKYGVISTKKLSVEPENTGIVKLTQNGTNNILEIPIYVYPKGTEIN